MIRDPSDGSVKPLPNADELVADGMRAAQKLANYLVDQANERLGFPPVIDTTTSGLPAAAARDADRHQRSREWLADYRAGKFKPKEIT